MTATEWIGAGGVSLLLLAFLLNLTGVLRRVAPVYQLLNLVGAGLACWASWRLDFMPFVVLEAAWAAVALAALTGTLPSRD